MRRRNGFGKVRMAAEGGFATTPELAASACAVCVARVRVQLLVAGCAAVVVASSLVAMIVGYLGLRAFALVAVLAVLLVLASRRSWFSGLQDLTDPASLFTAADGFHGFRSTYAFSGATPLREEPEGFIESLAARVSKSHQAQIKDAAFRCGHHLLTEWECRIAQLSPEALDTLEALHCEYEGTAAELIVVAERLSQDC